MVVVVVKKKSAANPRFVTKTNIIRLKSPPHTRSLLTLFTESYQQFNANAKINLPAGSASDAWEPPQGKILVGCLKNKWRKGRLTITGRAALPNNRNHCEKKNRLFGEIRFRSDQPCQCVKLQDISGSFLEFVWWAGKSYFVFLHLFSLVNFWEPHLEQTMGFYLHLFVSLFLIDNSVKRRYVIMYMDIRRKAYLLGS